MPTAKATRASAAGITTDSSGARVIPASTRPDGSTREEIRVRPGYRPPEDVEIYRNRATEAWKSRGSGGVPGAAGLKEDTASEAKSAAAAKNAKRREARKRAKATDDAGKDGADGTVEGQSNGGADPANETTAPANTDSATKEEDPQIERDKKLKKLKKKLRAARELQTKRDKGEGLLPEQSEKVDQIDELMRELQTLGISEEEVTAV